MQTTLNAIEVTGTISSSRNLELDEDLPENISSKVRVIVLYSANDEDFSERQWQQAAASNQAFDFLNDSAEDIYTLEDGKPLQHEV
jgi:hypothetical protein